MSYYRYLEEFCEKYLEDANNVHDVFGELPDKLILELLDECPALKNALMDELKTWHVMQNKAYDKEGWERAIGGKDYNNPDIP